LNQLIDKYKPELIIFNHATAYIWTDQLLKLPEWKPIYFDDNFAVYSNVNTGSNSGEALQRGFNAIVNDNGLDTSFQENNIIEILRLKKTPGFDHWLSGFYEKQNNQSGILNMANYALQNNMLREAEILYLNYLYKTQNGFEIDYHKDAFINLGEIYLADNKPDNALLCFESYLKLDPGDKSIIQKVTGIRSGMNKN